mgnify:CR=1 FL=1|jgi:Uncharacterized protein conserved in bacteria
MQHRRRLFVATGLALACGVSVAADSSAEWPRQPVRLLVGYPAGGPTDSAARVLAEAMSKETGQQFVVENRSGAEGSIAVNAVVRANPDGYMLVVSLKGAMSVAPVISKLPYDPLVDLSPIATLGQSPILISTRPDSGIKTLSDIKKVYEQRGGKLSIGYVGALNQMVAEQLMQELGVEMLRVPYKGGPAAMADLVGGRVDMTVGDAAGPVVEQIKAGRLVGLAVTSARRAAELPNVPTVSEQGFGLLEGTQWYGLWGPAKMPADLVDRIHKLVAQVMRQPAAIERLAHAHIEPYPASLEQMRALMKTEDAHWRKVAEKAGIKP